MVVKHVWLFSPPVPSWWCQLKWDVVSVVEFQDQAAVIYMKAVVRAERIWCVRQRDFCSSSEWDIKHTERDALLSGFYLSVCLKWQPVSQFPLPAAPEEFASGRIRGWKSTCSSITAKSGCGNKFIIWVKNGYKFKRHIVLFRLYSLLSEPRHSVIVTYNYYSQISLPFHLLEGKKTLQLLAFIMCKSFQS